MKSKLVITPGFTFKKDMYSRHWIGTDEKVIKHWFFPNTKEVTYLVKVALQDGSSVWTFDLGYKEAEKLYKDIVKQLKA